MKAYTKGFVLAVLAIYLALFGWIVPTGGVGPVVAPCFLLLAFVAAGIGFVGRFGSPKVRQWVENNF